MKPREILEEIVGRTEHMYTPSAINRGLAKLRKWVLGKKQGVIKRNLHHFDEWWVKGYNQALEDLAKEIK